MDTKHVVKVRKARKERGESKNTYWKILNVIEIWTVLDRWFLECSIMFVMNKRDAVCSFDLFEHQHLWVRDTRNAGGILSFGNLQILLSKDTIQMHFQISPLAGYLCYTRGGLIISKGFLKLFLFWGWFPILGVLAGYSFKFRPIHLDLKLI